jgi:hypothetical protein
MGKIVNCPFFALTPELKALYDEMFGEGPANTPQNIQEAHSEMRQEKTQNNTSTARVMRDIRELRNRYAGTEAEYKAPNGKPSELLVSLREERGREAWYVVRTGDFKEWFGDWERAARIEKLREAPSLALDKDAYQGKYELTKESMLSYLQSLQKSFAENPIINKDTQAAVMLGRKGIKKIIGYGLTNDIYQKILAHIPELTEKATFIIDEDPNRSGASYRKYRHLVAGIEIQEKPYTVHIVLGENGGHWYYDHMVTEIDKGSILEGIQVTTPGRPNASLSKIKDTTLLRILQANPSKATDRNGEPEARTNARGEPVFINSLTGQEKAATGNAGTYSNENP